MKNIAGKLVKVMEECSGIRKNGQNAYHHYQYVVSSDVLEKVNASLVKQKIASVVLPEILDSTDVTTNKGTTEHLVTVRVNITLLDGDSGESVVLVGIGSGQDAGDKAVMKAQSAAIKYAYMLSLAISTTDDPEADSRTDESVDPVDTKPSALHEDPVCTECGVRITVGILTVSMNKFGRPLCMKCQKKSQGVA